MPGNGARGIFDKLRALARGRTDAGDAQLLQAFINTRDEAAFETLVRRHGAMVFGVCRRVLREHHGAEDAFQATFLVLVKKAASIRPREMVANWLYGVAYQTALRAKVSALKRRAKESQAMPRVAAADNHWWDDLQPVLDEELSRLPDNYRVPIVLCDLEGKTRKDAARQLGWQEGTLHGRLARARILLARRLTQRGVTLSGGVLAGILTEHAASASVAPTLICATLHAAALSATTTAAASAAVGSLVDGVIKAMFIAKLKTAAFLLVTGAVLTTALGVTYRSGASVAAGERGATFAAFADDKPAQNQPKAKPKSVPLDPAERLLIELWLNDMLLQPPDKPKPATPNPIDRLILQRWLTQAERSPSDAEFIRRLYLDLTGTLPTPDDVKKFLADQDADKRAKLVDRLLAAGDAGDRLAELARLVKFLDNQELRDAVERALAIHEVDRAVKRATENIRDPQLRQRTLEQMERRVKEAKTKIQP
jgi:RNA polymerase sigma factor (sigma-70 family)